MPCVSIQIKTFICISGGCSWLSKFYGRISFYKRLQSWCLVRFGGKETFYVPCIFGGYGRSSKPY
uniref:Uncharacterized protein n=1 Tax=Siphoviridae sp. ctYh54 TaxID=2826379 RepID=A0A8S5ME16_9CAUD|nr:MAG TPA: hypothetical protein [Siphoviridae sp. ctYh54]